MCIEQVISTYEYPFKVQDINFIMQNIMDGGGGGGAAGGYYTNSCNRGLIKHVHNCLPNDDLCYDFIKRYYTFINEVKLIDPIQPLLSHSQVISYLYCHTQRSSLTSGLTLTDHIQPLVSHSQFISNLWGHTRRSYLAFGVTLTYNIQPLVSHSQFMLYIQIISSICCHTQPTSSLVSHSQMIPNLSRQTHRSYPTSDAILTDHIQPLTLCL